MTPEFGAFNAAISGGRPVVAPTVGIATRSASEDWFRPVPTGPTHGLLLLYMA